MQLKRWLSREKFRSSVDAHVIIPLKIIVLLHIPSV